jgi:cell division protein FtsA
MAKPRKDDVIVGLDIGTTKVCAIVGVVTPEGIDIIGIGSHPSTGLKKGMVVHIDDTVTSIRRAIDEAELMAGVEISTVYTGIAGGHIKGFNSSGIVAIKEGEVKPNDLSRVIEAAKAVSIPTDREVIHILPQEYVVDEQAGIRDPLGITGVRLEARVHIVTGQVAAAQNLVRCANKTGLNVADIVLQQIASSEAVLSDEEKELGVALVDIGGGTTDIAVFYQGAIAHTAVIAVGGNQITNDIAMGLRTPGAEAEQLKVKYGCALSSMVQREETIEVASVGDRKPRIVSRQLLTEIIEPRLEELFSLAHSEIQKTGYEDRLASGLVITGGSTLLEGMEELAEDVTGLPTRRGLPQRRIGGLVDVVKSPMYATGVGLVLYGALHAERRAGKGPMFRIRDDENIYARVKSRMRQWLKEFF